MSDVRPMTELEVKMFGELYQLRAELAEARRDIELAAGELLVAMPEPGTDMARVMIASALMRWERDEARRERDAYKRAKEENDDRFMAERDEARLERHRLREALEKIASDRYNFRDFCDIARAALEGKS